MNRENAVAHLKNMLTAPKMSDYLTKALVDGMEQKKLEVTRVIIEPCVGEYRDDTPVQHYSAMKVMFKPGDMPRYLDLIILNVDDLGDGDGDTQIFNHAYGWYKPTPKREMLPVPRDYWISNYVPGKDVGHEVNQTFLDDSRPMELTYAMAVLLLELAGLPLEERLHLVYLDSIGLRHVISLPNENDDDPEMTYVVIDTSFFANYSRSAKDYRLETLREFPHIVGLLLNELKYGTDEDVTDAHPLDTEDNKVEWAHFGPYHTCYRQNTMFVYTGANESMLPAQALIEVETASFSDFRPTHHLVDRQQVFHALHHVPALYQESAGSTMARDILASAAGNPEMRTIALEVRVNDQNEPIWLRVRQGDAVINFNLQY